MRIGIPSGMAGRSATDHDRQPCGEKNTNSTRIKRSDNGVDASI